MSNIFSEKFDSMSSFIFRQIESNSIYAQTKFDRLNWPESTHINAADIPIALEENKLATVPRQGLGWRLIGRLNGMPDGESNLANPRAIQLLDAIGLEWSRSDLGKLNDLSSQQLFLSVTSLYRSEVDQSRLLNDKNTKYRAAAISGSSHRAGAAIDISLRSAYLRVDNNVIPVSLWKNLELFPGNFIPTLRPILASVTEQFGANLVIEHDQFNGKREETIAHICISAPISEE